MHIKVEISAETKEQADDIMNALLAKKLVTGGQIIAAPARFLWKGEITDMNYWIITSFSLQKHAAAISETVRQISVEEVPMITFLDMHGNQELLDWISAAVA